MHPVFTLPSAPPFRPGLHGQQMEPAVTLFSVGYILPLCTSERGRESVWVCARVPVIACISIGAPEGDRSSETGKKDRVTCFDTHPVP